MPAFHAKLRDARRARGLTQCAVANALGFSQHFVSQLERGLIPARLASLTAYAALLDFDLQATLAEIETAIGRPLRDVFRDADFLFRTLPTAADSVAQQKAS